MKLLDILSDIAAQAGYTIGSTGQDAINKTRAIRRFTVIKSDIISRFGGKWPANYREGWLPLVPLDQTGTATWTRGSRTVTGASTSWTSAMNGYKMKGPDGAWYKIASVSSTTVLVLTQPYQGVTTSGSGNTIWKDEYRLYPEVLTVGGFIDYMLPGAMNEAWPRNMKDSYSNPSAAEVPNVYTVIGRDSYVSSYSTGTVSATINTCVWTGLGTSWLASLEPGMTFTVGSYVYHIRRVNSDTELETYQLAVAGASGATYTAMGKNAIIIRFKQPTDQRIVNYWYWAKDYPLLNDNDEDWICELYPKVIINGVLKYDYADKSDSMRLDRATLAYERSIEDMKVAMDNGYTGTRILGYDIPDAARE